MCSIIHDGCETQETIDLVNSEKVIKWFDYEL
jgi:hypothetical protein